LLILHHLQPNKNWNGFGIDMNMKHILFIFFFLPAFLFAQIDDEEQEDYDFIIIEGDSVPHEFINLDEIKLLSKLKFDDNEARRRYLILRRKTIKVYPYAKLAAERLVELNERLASLDRKSDKKRYAKKIQKYLEEEFTEELKKMTRTEGQILVKLIHRQTGKTAFELIKELRSGWKAFWSNNTANLFDISLKREFDPENVKEDYLIEDILQRNFQNGVLEPQKPAFDIDYFALTDKWFNQKQATQD